MSHPWGFRHTIKPAGHWEGEPGETGVCWHGAFPSLLTEEVLGVESRGGRVTITVPGRADGFWQESGCHGHPESPAGDGGVCFSGGSCSTYRGPPCRAVQLLGERFSAGVESVGLPVPEGHSSPGRWALRLPGPERAHTCQGWGERCVRGWTPLHSHFIR